MPSEIAERIRNAKSPDDIPDLLRNINHLTGEEIRGGLFGALGAEHDDGDCRREYFLSDADLKNLYLGCKQWAESDPDEVCEWIESELHQKSVSGLHLHESGVLAALTGFTEGVATHGLDKAFSIVRGFTWAEDHFDAVVCGLYPEIERRPMKELMDWSDSFTEFSFCSTSVVAAIQERVVREDPEAFVRWMEDDSVGEDVLDVRGRRYVVGKLASIDMDRATEWIRDLEKRRSGPERQRISRCC